MKIYFLFLFCLSLSFLSAQTPTATRGSATIQVAPTDNAYTNIKSAHKNIQDINKWIDVYEFELIEGKKTTGVSPDGRSANLNMSKSNRSASEDLVYNSRSSLKNLATSLDQFEKTTTDNQRKSLSDLQQAQRALDKSLKSLYKSIVERGDYNV